MGSHTGSCSLRVQQGGLLYFKGLQFLSTRVALRHYDPEEASKSTRISTSVVAASEAALRRQASNLSWRPAQGLVLCSHATGDWDPCVSLVLPSGAWHRAMGTCRPRY